MWLIRLEAIEISVQNSRLRRVKQKFHQLDLVKLISFPLCIFHLHEFEIDLHSLFDSVGVSGIHRLSHNSGASPYWFVVIYI